MDGARASDRASAGPARNTSKARCILTARCSSSCQAAQTIRGNARSSVPSTAVNSRSASRSGGGSCGTAWVANSRRISRKRVGSKTEAASDSDPRLTRPPPVAARTFSNSVACRSPRRLVRVGLKK